MDASLERSVCCVCECASSGKRADRALKVMMRLNERRKTISIAAAESFKTEMGTNAFTGQVKGLLFDLICQVMQ